MSDSLHLFLVEDDDDTAFLIRKSLQRVGHQVTRCRDGTDALIVLAQSTFDLVLLDQRLPDMEGLELLHRLNREGIVVPVLMITGIHEVHLATCVLKAGALDYIVKDPALTFLTELPKRVAESVRRHRLEQTNQLLVTALESARDGVIITDLQGTIIEVNRSLEEQSGYSRQELIGQTPRLFKSGIHGVDFYQRMWQTILARTSWQGELTNRRKDGQLRQVSMTISPIVDAQSRLTHFVGIQRDVTDHKRLEQQLIQMQKMQSVGTLAGGIAHEFNNLMAGINGYASLGLREVDVSPLLTEFLTNIVNLSERAANLTRQLLAFARKPALVRQRTSLPELLRSTAELVTRTLQQEVDLDLDVGSAVPLVVEGDPNQLQQAIVNLALNGRDAILERLATKGRSIGPSDGGGTHASQLGRLLFRLRPASLTEPMPAFPQAIPPGDYLLMQVQDDGTGMTPVIRNQALDPFFTTKEIGQGTGLGLPMVYGIIQAHRGFLTIDSEPGQGTTMGVYLPAMVDSPHEPERSVFEGEIDLVESETVPGRSILVIDDEEAVIDVMRRFLEIAGHTVRCVTTSHAGLEHLGSGQPTDLIILDLLMPREDTHLTFQRMRQECPQVPILLCTGLAETPLVRALLDQPHTAILRKPFRMNELWYSVNQILSASRASPEIVS
jgi:PAS domain S-box-containing protein